MAYVPQTWTNGAAGGTPISASRLSHMEDGIEAALPTYNVNAYGAAGDGVTNDAAAFTAAIAAAAAAGGGIVAAPSASYRIGSTLTASGLTDIHIRGLHREGTELLCTDGFLSASGSSDRWTVSDLYIRCTTSTNTSYGVVVDYPRRWTVERCRFEGFGADSIRFRGGINSTIRNNYILAKDPSNTNGNAGIHVEKSSADVVATTIVCERNYIGSGRSYGILWEYATNSTSIGDIIELINPGAGLRLNQAAVTVIDLYTEGVSGNSFEMHDSPTAVLGSLRNEPVVTWSATASADRHITRIARNWVNVGKGLLFGGSTAGSDVTTSPSIRAGSGTPEGTQTGVVGSVWLRTDGAADSTLYRKESGSGNTGWVSSSSLAGANAANNNSASVIHTTARENANTSTSLTSGTLYLQFFTPILATTVTRVGFCTGSSGTSGLTLGRVGLFVDNGDGTVTLVARGDSDTSILGAANTVYNYTFSTTGGFPSSYSLTAGSRYATGLLVVGSGAGSARGPVGAVSDILNQNPRIIATGGTGLSDIPTTAITVSTSGQLYLWSQVTT